MPKKQKKEKKIVQEILGPQIKSTQEEYRNQGAGLQAAYNALAKINEGVAPAIQGTYDAASARQAVIGKGYSAGFELAMKGADFDANALLAQQGSPQQVNSQGAAGANALYGFGGAIPAGTLNQQGAAFTSAAKLLPGQDTRLGIDAVKGANIGGRSAVKELEAKRPALIQDALGTINDAQAKRDQLAFEAKVFGVKQGNEEFDQQLALMKEMRARGQADISNSFRAAGLGLSRQRLKLAQARENRLGKPKKKGGFSDSQKQRLAEQALDTASEAFEEDADPIRVLDLLTRKGIPLSYALSAIGYLARSDGASSKWKAAGVWAR